MEVAVNIRVRATSKSVVGDAEIQHQRHRTRRIREVTSQLNVPTSLTPALSHLLRFYFVGGVKEVSNLINRPVEQTFANHKPRAAAPPDNVVYYESLISRLL